MQTGQDFFIRSLLIAKKIHRYLAVKHQVIPTVNDRHPAFPDEFVEAIAII
jgi:hypothetical protein